MLLRGPGVRAHEGARAAGQLLPRGSGKCDPGGEFGGFWLSLGGEGGCLLACHIPVLAKCQCVGGVWVVSLAACLPGACLLATTSGRLVI